MKWKGNRLILIQNKDNIIEHLTEEDKTHVKLVFAFNGIGKTQLSNSIVEKVQENGKNVIYYNAYTEDLFRWDNGIGGHSPELMLDDRADIIRYIFDELGLGEKVQETFENYVRKTIEYDNLSDEQTGQTNRFNFRIRGQQSTIKISKGEESVFIWSVFISLLEEIVTELGENDAEKTVTRFKDLKFIIIDDPVTSLDEQYIVKIANGLARLIKKVVSFKDSDENNKLKYPKIIITTHHPLFFNVFFNELGGGKYKKYLLEQNGDRLQLREITTDSPFAYHLEMLFEIKSACANDQIKKYHFGLLRQILEKIMTFTGYSRLSDLLAKFTIDDNDKAELNRLMNLYSHGKHSDLEIALNQKSEEDLLIRTLPEIIENLKFKVN